METTTDRPVTLADQGEQLRGELDVIRLIQARSAGRSTYRRTGVCLGIGDDCAILKPRRGEEIVVTTDFSLEGRHFRRDWHSPQSIGHRTLARGLSDLAAMGARPVAAFLSLALPKAVAHDAEWLNAFLQGLLLLAERAEVPLAGGDTSEAPGDHILADIVLVGAVPAGKALRRDRAQPGDAIYVTGFLGGSSAQLDALTRGVRNEAVPGHAPNDDTQPHFFPEPRLRTGRYLRKHAKATAAIDISDGLSTDLAHLCRASRLCAEIEADRIPLHPLLARSEKEQALQTALHGGEDYELLFTAPEELTLRSSHKGVALTRIGTMLPCQHNQYLVSLVRAGGASIPLEPNGWEHLR